MIKKFLLAFIFIVFVCTNANALPVFTQNEIDKKYSELNMILAIAYLTQNANDSAIKTISNVLSYDKDNPNANFYMALMLEDKSFSKSSFYHKKAIDLDKDNSKYIYSYGSYLLRMGKLKPAYAYLTKASELSLFEPMIFYDAGVVAIELKKMDEGIEYFKKAIKVDNEFSQAYNNLCYSYSTIGNFAQALPSCLRAVELDENSAESLDSLAFTYDGLKIYDKAIDFYEKALAIKKDEAEIYFHYAATLQKVERYNDAITNYQMAMGLDKSYKSKSASAIKNCKRMVNNSVKTEKK